MDSLHRHEIVKIKTLDGVLLEALFYEVEGPAPAVIMSHGVSLLPAGLRSQAYRSQFNCVKEMSLGETAEAFQSAGFNTLIYDARGVGGSGGMPRNEIDPMKMVEDIPGKCNIV